MHAPTRNLLLTAAIVTGVAACAADEAEGPGGASAPGNDTAEDGTVDDTPDEAVDDDPTGSPQPVVETVAEGFDGPWGLAFLPDGERLLVTQIDGSLTLVDTTTGEATELAGVPDVETVGQGGLLDVAVDPQFEDEQWIYLTYADGDGSGDTTTHLARARLDVEAGALDDVEELFAAEPFLDSGQHFGSRVQVAPDGNLIMSIGDRGNKDFDDHPAQDTANVLGSTVRLEPDGSVPDDNPFVDDADVADEIFSFGHRNVQGMTVHPETDEVWISEHGEEGGDELNVLEAGGNFGWPITHTGCEYGTDTPVGEDPFEVDEVVDPVFFWECGSDGFPPAGMAFYDGEQFPDWQGDLLVGGLQTEEVARFTVDGRDVASVESLLGEEGWRIRDVAVGPQDGAVYVAIDGDDVALVRLVADPDGA